MDVQDLGRAEIVGEVEEVRHTRCFLVSRGVTSGGAQVVYQGGHEAGGLPAGDGAVIEGQ
jgi:hypothetical protein